MISRNLRSTTHTLNKEEKEEDTWINRFCNRYENSYFCKVDKEFISDSFNLYGINSDFHIYQPAISLILDSKREHECDSEIDEEELQASAEMIYGMIHARYLITSGGLEAMEYKYKLNFFGTCPRVYCNHQFLLPIGESDKPGISTVKLFCPCCKELYHPPPQFEHLDGAFFGTTFPHLFLLQYPQYLNNQKQSFTPSIFGFKIHKSR